MWRMALLPNISKFKCFMGKHQEKSIFFHFLKHQNGAKADNQTLDFEPYFSLYLLF